MTWSYFIIFAIISVICWTVGAVASWKGKKTMAYALTGIGLAVFFTYILCMWINLERPPLRTMGETRLWYSFFLPLAGLIVYSRWHYKWILPFSCLLATVFVGINILKPEIHSKTLMPALQSPWFAPHVIVYMMSYALLGAAMVMAVHQEERCHRRRTRHHRQPRLCRPVVRHTRYAHGGTLGQGCLGALLGLGSERDLGSHYLVSLFSLYPLSLVPTFTPEAGPHHAHRVLLPAANVLVGHQLLAFSAGSQRAYL